MLNILRHALNFVQEQLMNLHHYYPFLGDDARVDRYLPYQYEEYLKQLFLKKPIAINLGKSVLPFWEIKLHRKCGSPSAPARVRWPVIELPSYEFF